MGGKQTSQKPFGFSSPTRAALLTRAGFGSVREFPGLLPRYYTVRPAGYASLSRALRDNRDPTVGFGK
ncbi:hypothetical protein MPRM_28900 [Mycobacterium parmense]|uniref:Uncharacterized protein n=1 Tax=Mycobacterium parmense TaxID=185642 RepID=A0A7I7YVA5_9MYCO|nr:hypothetical protein [Mycobacterium parmense]MCV7350953.1 hypothetical protein [Mycobacterium parmense]ORW53526.1 hypothetical protein AWC20_19925 [Mycobacterium parmense]BBZ45609.1 hypothetical protein MPRM_28900 [Mycobacterium parmense]